MIHAKTGFLKLLAAGQEDFHFGVDDLTAWVITFRSDDLTQFAKWLGFLDLHEAIHAAHAQANAENLKPVTK